MLTTLADRLKLAMAGPPKITGVALAKACNVKPPSVSDWLNGRTKTMEASNLLAASRLLNVDPDWLAKGLGPMRPAGPAVAAQEQRPDYAALPPGKAEAIDLLYQLSEEQLTAAISFMKWQLANTPPQSNGHPLHMAA